MTSIHVINPGDVASLRNTLRVLRELSGSREVSEERKVLLRIPESTGTSIDQKDLLLKSMPMERRYDDEIQANRFVDFKSAHPYQEAYTELLKAVTDVDISLPMGYTIFEVPFGATETDQIETDAVLTNEDLYSYLVAINATPMRIIQETDVASSGRWTGVEEIVDREWLQSTMVFETSFRYVETTQREAIDYLTIKLAEAGSLFTATDQRILKTTAIGDIIRAKIYVIPNTRCEIPIIKESPLFTTPVSKQRLLYIYDFIREWFRGHLKMWVEIRRDTKPINPQSRAACFQYRVQTIGAGWTKLPTLSVNPRFITYDFPLAQTELWSKFCGGSVDIRRMVSQHTPTGSPETETIVPRITPTPTPILIARMKAVIDILNAYGFDMEIGRFVGGDEDYVPDRSSFTLPVREVIPEEQPLSRGRGHGRPRGRDGEHNVTRGFSSRGRGRPRGSNEVGANEPGDPIERGRGGIRFGEEIYRGRGRPAFAVRGGIKQ